ncbi:hypothetical protein TTHERM_00158420 (macronuclear) [Tetrahymena thermophila SB210]|uniref:Uncharacterized protein n=1 Tax=Tetrahymena thermophila (strain SB210) TaxID=312017 RepID=Q22W92_TETTS|nr:hypothetical protein TTHERM_00158420 [Tetrahymena thermophila SB210]EAR89525.2 hypothetical protein TTHERM_00158420 [Tetrahymena thermophila SB210]|eukprot:XP_001009770.2 hypothetical protein TTHERM_00158420 [Tetrahymena thermophila SB210]
MSENNQENKINILADKEGVDQQSIQQNNHNENPQQNHLTVPQQPKHTVQDDIAELSQAIQKKRNSQRKSVFSNHEEMNLGELISKHSQDQEKNNGNLDSNEINTLQQSMQDKANQNNLKQDQNDASSDVNNKSAELQLPVKPQHNVQDDIKEFNEHIVQRRSVRRASRFQEENLSHLQEIASQLQDNANKKQDENENNQNTQVASNKREEGEENDQNQIQSLNDLHEKEKKLENNADQEGEDQNQLLKENEEHTQQKSISELQEEAKQKPNALNEVIKLSSQIQVKRDLKRKSTFSMTNIKHDDDEEDNDNNKGDKQDNDQQQQQQQSSDQAEQHHSNVSPGKEKKQNAFNEIIKLNNEIHFKSSLKRKSTFSLPVIQDDDDEQSESKDKPKSVKLPEENEISKIKEQPSIEEKGDNEENESQNNNDQKEDEQHQIQGGKKPNAFVEILKLNSDIQVKRQLTRKSTFSLPVHLDDEEEGKDQENQDKKSEDNNNDNDDMQSQPSSTSLQQNINENAGKDAEVEDQQENGSGQKKPSAYQEILSLNNQIQSKRSLTRKSTFSVPHIPDEEEEEGDKNEKKDDNSKITEESHHLDDTQEMAKKKPNALNEIIELNNVIQHKRDLKRKSTFSIPVIRDEDLEQKQEEQQENKQIKNNALNEILELSDQIQVKRNSRRKSTFSQGLHIHEQNEQQKNEQNNLIQNEEGDNQHEEGAEDESEEARLQRQKKKKNLMDYKEQEADHPVKNAQRNKSQQKKHIFLEENKQNFRKVIHPSQKQQQQTDKNNNQEEQVLEVNIQQKEPHQKQVDDDDNQKAKQEFDQIQNLQKQEILNINLNSNQQSPEKSLDKKQKNERRDEFALQRKLEYLTAKSAKNELIRKEKGNIPHNKFIAQELSKEIKIREANKRKRELETMLAQINREIQVIRNSDPDYESLAINNLHIKSVQDENQRSQNNHLYSSIESQKNSGRILPPIKKNNQIKEMIKIAEDQVANQNAVSIVQKYKKEKEFKRQKREQEFQQVNNQIYKEVELRRQQNETLHEKIILEKRQKLLHKKQQNDTKKAEQQQLLVASKNFVKELHQIGPGKATDNYLSQVNQIDSEYKFGPYQTPELDAQKLGLQQIRNLQKGEQLDGAPLPNFMKNKNNNDFKKLLEENKINRDREIKIIENRKDLYNKRMEYSKSVKNNLLRGGRKLDISSNLLFQDEGLNKNRIVVSSSVTNLEKKKKQLNQFDKSNNKYSEEQDENKQIQEQELIDIPQSQSTKSVNNKVWRVVKH